MRISYIKAIKQYYHYDLKKDNYIYIIFPSTDYNISPCILKVYNENEIISTDGQCEYSFNGTMIDWIINYGVFYFYEDRYGYPTAQSIDNKRDYASIIIQRYYKKYRYNLFKKRRDTLKRELTAYIYHPSRLKFEI